MSSKSGVNSGTQPTIGMWMYQNGGGSEIQQQIVNLLKQKNIHTITGLNLANASASGGEMLCNGTVMEDLSAFFSYNAGEQSPFQVYMYQALSKAVPTLNNYQSFAITEDKFLTAHMLNQANIRTAEYRLISHVDIPLLKSTVREWEGHVVYKPTDGWGGNGIVKIEDERSLDVLIPFLNRIDMKHFYLEKFINYDKTDYRVDIVDGQFVGCYGRSAPSDDWKTNITTGGSIILREPDDDVIELALKAAKVTGLEIAGVDLLYDLDAEEYVVLEVNGIPAFATPEQEEIGLNFNQLKIDKIVKLIERTVEEAS
ncbi:RimK family alpha-L-glutamate ligase [Paraglaciecola sp. L3A3]|uniref:ATP-grasp domain-containing protein n=1 Tax=Paraglaciecola sp. L3A3 TaxID=2686358 RepID=UPI00131AEF51|nr:ATP-grasp domain-containing protein [Paraglaciecola sp. L3A3]